MRYHYMTLCFVNNTGVYHTMKDGVMLISFEQPCIDGVKTLVMNHFGIILRNDGYTDEEIMFFRDFLQRNVAVMWDEEHGIL